MPEIFTNLIGYIAATVGTFLMVPQIVRSYKLKQTRDLSMVMVVLYVVNGVLWLTYGLLLSSLPLILANGIALIIGVVQLILKIKYN